MIGRLLCTLGMHRPVAVRWGYDLTDGSVDWKIVRCKRAMCRWGRKLR